MTGPTPSPNGAIDWSQDQPGCEPIRTPRGLDFVVAAFSALPHRDLVFLLQTPCSDLDDLTPLEWLEDEGSPVLVVLALMDTAELVTRVRDLLGTHLTAHIASVADGLTVSAWAGARGHPDDATQMRLGVACCAASLLEAWSADASPPVWFQTPNPLLGDAAPARVLREQSAWAGGFDILAASRRAVGLPL